MMNNVLRMLEDGARVQKRVKVKYVVFRGRRPHGSLHFAYEKPEAARESRGPRKQA